MVSRPVSALAFVLGLVALTGLAGASPLDGATAPLGNPSLAVAAPMPSVPVQAPDVPQVHLATPLGQIGSARLLDGVTRTAPPPRVASPAPSPVRIVLKAAETPTLLALLLAGLAGVVEAARLALGKPLSLLGRLAWRAARHGLTGTVRAVTAVAGVAGGALVPLFSRIEAAEVLENPVRSRMHEAIQQASGLSIAQVRERAGAAWGTTIHHLRRLEDHGLVVSTRSGSQRLYYPVGTPAAKERDGLAALAQGTGKRIATLVGEHPGIDQKGVCEALDIRNPAASKHLSRFERLGLVRRERSGRSCLYHPTERLTRALAVAPPTPWTSAVATPL